MSGILNALLAANGGIVRPFLAWDVLGDNIPGSLATATFSLAVNGSISGLGTPNNLGTNGSPSWYAPNVNIGANYFVRFTPTVGTLSTNDAPTFTQINATRAVTKTGTAGAASCTFTIDIATDIGGTNIVLTSTGNLVRITHT